MEDKIQDIIDRNNLTVKEKLERLDSLQAWEDQLIQNAKSALKEDYEYCRECGEYYHRRAWGNEIREEVRSVCTNPLQGGYLDPYEYEDVNYKVWYKVCPRGHRIGKDALRKY